MKSCAAGYTEWLLFHIWKTDPNTKSSLIGVNLPETIIYRLGKPFFWYFTLATGEILRKAKGRVSHKFILQDFLDSPNEILAYYLGFNGTSKDKANSAVIEFFTKDSFVDFIHNRDKCSTGILQMWIEPRSNQNSLIKVQWSQQFCLIERRVNKHRLDDTRVEFYEKLLTYEGMEYNSKLEPVTAPWIISEIQKTCIGIASHITAVTGGNVTISRMVLFFKQDKYDKIWMMYCSALKVLDLSFTDNNQSLEWKELEVTVPKHISMKKLPLNVKGLEVKKNRCFCVGCNFLTRENAMYEISLSTLVRIFEKGKDLPEQGQSKREFQKELEENDDLVPKVVKRLNKGVTNNKYEEMKNDPTWDHLLVKVCEDCFLHFTSSYSVPKPKYLPQPHGRKSQTPPPASALTRQNSEKQLQKPLPQIKIPVLPKPPSKPSLLPPKVTFQSLVKLPKSVSKPNLSKHLLESSSKYAASIYGKVSITKSPNSNLSTSYTRGKLNSSSEAEFLQDTFALLKSSISKLDDS